jgi:hypothetical protein
VALLEREKKAHANKLKQLEVRTNEYYYFYI